jgi:hypothetical protein
VRYRKNIVVARLAEAAAAADQRAEEAAEEYRAERAADLAEAVAAAPAVAEKLRSAAAQFDQVGEDMEQWLDAVRSARRALDGLPWNARHLSATKEPSAVGTYRSRAAELRSMAALLDSGDGAEVSTTELDRLGILRAVRISG